MNTRKPSRVENGVEVCNTCVHPADSPYRYETAKGERGCISKCHDVHVRHNTKPNWMSPRYVMPKWILEARKAIKALAEVPAND